MEAFNDIHDETDFVGDADPMIRAAMQREGGAAILQDLHTDTYYANTVGKTSYKGASYELYLRELRQNLAAAMHTKMPYMQLEEFMVVLGYESADIRAIFEELTGLDPVKIEMQRQEDVNLTPANIPWYNLGWGWSTKKGAESYFMMPGAGAIYTVYAQVDDMTRKDLASFLKVEDGIEYMKAICKNVHQYDKSAAESVEWAMEDVREESQKQQYKVMANYLYKHQQNGPLDREAVTHYVSDAVYSGTLTEREGQDLIEIYADNPPESNPRPETDQDGPAKTSPDKEYRQDADVMDEVKRSTPDDFFKSVLPDRLDTIAPQHVKEVLSYVAHREDDIAEFDVILHSLEYIKHDAPKALTEVNPESGRPSGPPKATIAVILEISDKTLGKTENSRKYGLLVFYVSPDGEIGTSDSVKGEDDVIYGFTEEGLQQYFSRERAVKGMPEL